MPSIPVRYGLLESPLRGGEKLLTSTLAASLLIRRLKSMLAVRASAATEAFLTPGCGGLAGLLSLVEVSEAADSLRREARRGGPAEFGFQRGGVTLLAKKNCEKVMARRVGPAGWEAYHKKRTETSSNKKAVRNKF